MTFTQLSMGTLAGTAVYLSALCNREKESASPHRVNYASRLPATSNQPYERVARGPRVLAGAPPPEETDRLSHLQREVNHAIDLLVPPSGFTKLFLSVSHRCRERGDGAHISQKVEQIFFPFFFPEPSSDKNFEQGWVGGEVWVEIKSL